MKSKDDHEAPRYRDRDTLPSATQIAEISHDLKTFLNPIVGFSSVLLQDRERLQEDQLRQVGLIYESAHRLLDRIDAMVELFRLLGRATRPTIGQCDGHHVCQQVTARLSAALGSGFPASLQLLLPDEHLHCLCDPQLLARALGEIALARLGALDAGQVRLSYGPMPGDDSRLEFLISDDGPRLSDKERHSMERFLGGAGEDAGGERGIGLWLLLARQAARASDAEILLPADGRGHFAVVAQRVTPPPAD